MRYSKQTVNPRALIPDDEPIDVDALARETAQATRAELNAAAPRVRTATEQATATTPNAPAPDDVPVIDLGLDPADYTFHAGQPAPTEDDEPILPRPSERESFSTPSGLRQRAQPQPWASPAPDPWSVPQSPTQPSPAPAPNAGVTPQPPPPAMQPPGPGATPPQQQPQEPPVQAGQVPPQQQAQNQAVGAQAGVNPGQERPGTDDDNSPIISTVPTATGQERPEAAPMLMPETDRAKKFARAPGAFGPNADEQNQLARAEALDQRSDRIRRALGGIGSILGILGAGAGSPGLASLGMATMAGGRSVSPHNERQDAVREQIARRMQSMQAERQAAMQAAGQEQEQIASAREAERQGRLDEAQLGLTNARTDALRAEQEQAQLDSAIQSGNMDGARAIFRSIVGSLNDNSRVAQMARRFIASPQFATASAEDIQGYQELLRQWATSHHTGILSRGGGGGSTSSTWDPATGRFVDRRVGGRGVPEPTLPPTFEELQAMQQQAAQEQPPAVAAPMPATQVAPAPRRASVPRRGAPAPAQAGAPAPTDAATPPAAGTQVALPSEDEQLVMAARAAGIDPNTSQGLAYIASLRQSLRSRDHAEQRAARETVRQGLLANATEGNLPPAIPRDEWRLLTREADEHAQHYAGMRPLLASVHGANPAQLSAALHGGAAMSRVAGASDLRAEIGAFLNRYFHDFGGANITPEERERYMTAFASDSIVIDPAAFTRAMERAQRENLSSARTVISRLTRGRDEGWEYYRTNVLMPRRRRR